VAFSYERVGIIEEGDPITFGANVYNFKEISNVDDDCTYVWFFENGGSASQQQNPKNIELPYIKNGSPVQNPNYNVCLTIYRCDGTSIGTCCKKIVSEAPVCEWVPVAILTIYPGLMKPCLICVIIVLAK